MQKKLYFKLAREWAKRFKSYYQNLSDDDFKSWLEK